MKRVPKFCGKGRGQWVDGKGPEGFQSFVEKGPKVLWKGQGSVGRRKGSRSSVERVPKFCGKGRGLWVDGKGPKVLWKRVSKFCGRRRGEKIGHMTDHCT